MTLKIQESLVWDKHTGYLIGFVDLGDTENTRKHTGDFISFVDLGDTENTRKFSLGQTHRLSYWFC